jgi:UDP-N-acetylglucosamine 2-epimerase (non-hydrolysing)
MIAIILGTRPEIIKTSPIIRECQARNLDYRIIHTGQHYSYAMDRAFFNDLELPEPAYNLDTGSGSHAEQTGRIMSGVERILGEEQPEIVLVQGDTNTVLAGALAAAKLNIAVGHVEAGLRSFDRTMPEETNRVVADHVSSLLFAPTAHAQENLIHEGIDPGRIFMTGNTIVDAVYQNLDISKKKASILRSHDLEPNRYFLVTMHRAENVDSRERMRSILAGLNAVSDKFSLPVFFPIHPRTLKQITAFGLELGGIIPSEPLGFLQFLQLEANARCILTDSGGIQEEACILGVPCVTMRTTTERPETLSVGSNILTGSDPRQILEGVRLMNNRSNGWKNPFGDARAGERIVEISLQGN